MYKRTFFFFAEEELKARSTNEPESPGTWEKERLRVSEDCSPAAGLTCVHAHDWHRCADDCELAGKP